MSATNWDPWFGILPARVVGIAGARDDQMGFESEGTDGQTGGAFSEQFRHALQSPASDTDTNGSVTWVEAVSAAAAALRPKYAQDPVVAGTLSGTNAVSLNGGAAKRGRLYALLVGINDYGGAQNLKGPVNDVRKFGALLRSKAIGDSTTPSIQVLLDKEATYSAIESSLQRLTLAATEDDIVLLYYSGHVTRVPDVSGESPTGMVKVLLPRDFAAGKLLLVPEVVGVLGKSRARVAVLVIDG